jgi:hypothetical protein
VNRVCWEGMGTGLMMLACERELLGGSHEFDLGRVGYHDLMVGKDRATGGNLPTSCHHAAAIPCLALISMSCSALWGRHLERSSPSQVGLIHLRQPKPGFLRPKGGILA